MFLLLELASLPSQSAELPNAKAKLATPGIFSEKSLPISCRTTQYFQNFPIVFPFQRMSVFEPYPMRDTVQHFCERHLAKIKSYMTSLMVKLPLPVKCTIEERKGRKHAKLHFACQVRCWHFIFFRFNI